MEQGPEMKNNLPANWDKMDVSILATRGAILCNRFHRLSRVKKLPLAAITLFAGYHLVALTISPLVSLPALPIAYQIDPTPPKWLTASTAQAEPVSFDIGGGLTGDANLAWLADYAPKPESLSTEQLDGLAAALKADLAAHGKKVDQWKQVAALAPAPKITRADKVISKYPDRLKSGVVVVLENDSVVPVVSHVAGEWSVLLFKDSSCRVALGPIPSGCDDYRGSGGVSEEARAVFKLIQPKKG